MAILNKTRIRTLSMINVAFDKAREHYTKGKSITVYILDSKPVRSIPQNKYYWGVVLKTIADHTGYTSNEIHDVCKMMHNPIEFKTKKGVMTFGGSTSNMKKDEFSLYVDKIVNWAKEEMSLHIPTVQELEEQDYINMIENGVL